MQAKIGVHSVQPHVPMSPALGGKDAAGWPVSLPKALNSRFIDYEEEGKEEEEEKEKKEEEKKERKKERKNR